MSDFAEIKQKECLQKRLPQKLKLNSSRTLVLQSVLNAIKTHGRSSMNKEICGVLVGTLCWDRKPYLLIDGRIEGKFAEHQSGSVTFTSETWDYIHSELAEKYPARKIVGWYHTHPGFGIFLSNMDFFIHENFFSLRWQPAYVFDPQAETDGFFFWRGKNLEQEQVTVLEDAQPEIVRPHLVSGEKISVALNDALERKYRRMRLTLAAVLVCFLLLAIASGSIITLLVQELREQLRKNQNLPTPTCLQMPEPQTQNNHRFIPLMKDAPRPDSTPQKKPATADSQHPAAAAPMEIIPPKLSNHGTDEQCRKK